ALASTSPPSRPVSSFLDKTVAANCGLKKQPSAQPPSCGPRWPRRTHLCQLGFEIESGKASAAKLKRPVFFGQDGRPSRQYEIDGFHPSWRCGIEVEAGRAWMGNAIYRDLVQAMVMVDLDHLVLAVPMTYKYLSGGRAAVSKDYDNAVSVADALYSHTR